MKLLAILTIIKLPYPLYVTGKNTVLFPELVMLLSNWRQSCSVTEIRSGKRIIRWIRHCVNIRVHYTNLLGHVVCGHHCTSPSATEHPYVAHDCTMWHITGPFPSLNLLLNLKSNSWLISSLIQNLTSYIVIFLKASSCIIFLSI